jgi:hypothetical protein
MSARNGSNISVAALLGTMRIGLYAMPIPLRARALVKSRVSTRPAISTAPFGSRGGQWTLEELQRDIGKASALGYHNHHINEKDAAEKDGFSQGMIEGPENIVRIPKRKHEEITGWYMTKRDRFKDVCAGRAGKNAGGSDLRC